MPTTHDDAREPDAAELLLLVEREQARTVRALEPDARLLYGAWGAAWLIGFVSLWAWATGRWEVAGAVAGAVFAGCLAVAMAVTGVHVARRTAGLRGVSSRVGAMYGWSWFLAFLTLTAILNGSWRAGVPESVLGLLWSVLSALVVGTLYLAGGALWQDKVQYGLGVWILLAGAAGALAGHPQVYLVMALAGGGGMLLTAALAALRTGRGRTAP